MKLIDFFKEKILKQPKRLEEGKINTNNTKKENNLDGIKVEYIPKANTLEFAIEQYMRALIYGDGKISSYGALTSLSALDNSVAGDNYINQLKFLQNAKNGIYNQNMQVEKQPTNSEKPYFYHIIAKKESAIESRIYLNCKRENIAKIADKLARKLGNTEYYFKFNAEETALRRSEQFVFYIGEDPEETNRIVNAIESVKVENEKLFEKSEFINPFMKNFNGYIAYAPNVKSGKYNTLDGKEISIQNSYNTLLSKALEDCLVHAVREITAQDLNLSKKIKGDYFDEIQPYIVSGVLKSIEDNPAQKARLINMVEKYLEQSEQNNAELDIKRNRKK